MQQRQAKLTAGITAILDKRVSLEQSSCIMYAILSRLVWLLNFAAMYKLIRNKVRKGRQKDQVQVGDKKKQKKANGNKQKKKGDC